MRNIFTFTNKSYFEKKVIGILEKLTLKLNLIMSELENVEAKIAELQTSVDTLQAKEAVILAALLTAQAGSGMTAADAADLIAKIQAVQDDVDSTPTA